jgi:hypothetical protein
MSPIYRKPSYTEPASYSYTKRQWEIIEQDKLNRQTPFHPQIHFYPADLFILKAFDLKGRPLWERNLKWHDEDGYYVGPKGSCLSKIDAYARKEGVED